MTYNVVVVAARKLGRHIVAHSYTFVESALGRNLVASWVLLGLD